MHSAEDIPGADAAGVPEPRQSTNASRRPSGHEHQIKEEDEAHTLPIPGLFIRLIGTAEVLGALGLLMPMPLRIRPYLTHRWPAICLTMLMTGATVLSPAFTGNLVRGVPTLILGLLAALVVCGRWHQL